jgi:hypothetical protein
MRHSCHHVFATGETVLMSTYHHSSAPSFDHDASPSPAGTERPKKLTRAVTAAAGAVGLNLISALAILASGMDVVKEQIANNTTSEAGLTVGEEAVDTTSDRAQGLHTIYSSLAYSTIFWSLVLALLAWFALRGGRATRILSVVILVISLLVKAADLFIAMPTVSVIADAVFAVLALMAIVLFFRPDRNAYPQTARTQQRRQVY